MNQTFPQHFTKQRTPDLQLPRLSPLRPQPTDSIVIRSAQAEDAAGMAKVLVEGFSLMAWPWLNPIAQAGIQADLQARMGRKNLYQAFVAVDSRSPRQVIGTVEVTLQKSMFQFQPAYPYLASLTVAAGYRRQGIAQQLVRACEHQVYLWNRDSLYLHVLADNTAARRLYLNLGYSIQARSAHLNPTHWTIEHRILLHHHLISGRLN